MSRRISFCSNANACPSAPPPTIAEAPWASAGNSGPAGVGVADVNRDGRADVVAANFTTGNVTVLRNTTSPYTVPFQTVAAAVPGIGAVRLSLAGPFLTQHTGLPPQGAAHGRRKPRRI